MRSGRVPSRAAAGLALDVSAVALKRAARAHRRLGAAVWNLWEPWPVASGSAAVVLNVFAPRNAERVEVGVQLLRRLDDLAQRAEPRQPELPVAHDDGGQRIVVTITDETDQHPLTEFSGHLLRRTDRAWPPPRAGVPAEPAHLALQPAVPLLERGHRRTRQPALLDGSL
jgi:23S rRNA (guanine745-N1)-methyltransferase